MKVRHIVMWKLHESAQGNTKSTNIARMIDALLSCKDCVEGILEFEVGQSTDELEATYDVVLNSLFVNKAALDAYQIHPTHEGIKAFVADLRESRECVDYYIS